MISLIFSDLLALEQCQKLTLVLDKNGSVESLINAVANKLNWDMKLPCVPVVFEAFDSKIYKIFNPSDPISFFGQDDMICIFAPDTGEPALKVIDWQPDNSLDTLFSSLATNHNMAFSPYEESSRIPVYFSHSEVDDSRFSGTMFGLPSSVSLPKKVIIRIPNSIADALNEDQRTLECSRILGLYVYRQLLLNMIKYFKPLFPSKQNPSANDFIAFLNENEVPWDTFKDVLKITLIEGAKGSHNADFFYTKEILNPYSSSQRLIYPLEAVNNHKEDFDSRKSTDGSAFTLGSHDLLRSKDNTGESDGETEYTYYTFDSSGLKLFMVKWKTDQDQNFFGKDSLSKVLSSEFKQSVFAVILSS